MLLELSRDPESIIKVGDDGSDCIPSAVRPRNVATLGPPYCGWPVLSVVCEVLVKASVLLSEVSSELAMAVKGYTADNLFTAVRSSVFGIGLIRGLSP